MRISKYYKLGRTQPTLDFVDVDVKGDARVFIDPRALRLLPSEWGDHCVALLQSFFKQVLRHIKKGEHGIARKLLAVLHEPNETHLGYSRGRAKGRCLGRESVKDVWSALSKSEAVKSGLIEDLEDSILMVEGISADIISDMTTNIIRGPLIEYTQQMAGYYGIPLTEDIDSGPLWNPVKKEWYSGYVKLPITNCGKILLVPKVIVRRRMDYDVGEYYRHYLLETLMEVERNANTELVRLLKNGKEKIYIKDLKEKYGTGKSTIVRETRKHPEVLAAYRREKRSNYQPPMDHYDIAESDGTPSPDWDALLSALRAVPVGRDDYAKYEQIIESLLTALFYPSLTNPQVQLEIHEGRKRIDITYTNVARTGFFFWLGQHYPAPHVFIECKNYGHDLANPELDQMSGRFSPSRGQFGIITCRSFQDKERFIKRCQDTAKDHRGFILPLDDADLAALVDERKRATTVPSFPLMKQLFDRLIM